MNTISVIYFINLSALGIQILHQDKSVNEISLKYRLIICSNLSKFSSSSEQMNGMANLPI